MTAREMFEELGYKLVRNDSSLIKYEKFINDNCIQITFSLLLKKFIATYGHQKSGSYANDIKSDELKAVVCQAKELGWIEEEKKEIKQETNFEHYKYEILEYFQDGLAVVKGIPKICYKTNCNDCDFKINQEGCRKKVKEWLNQPYEKPTYKLTKFEIDLLHSCSQGYSPKYQFKNINSLTEMRKNGYFKCINRDETIEEILAKCEVVG